MRSPTTALLWEIWRRTRWSACAIVGLTALGWLTTDDVLGELLGGLSFLLLFGIFNYTEFSRDSGRGEFPRRLFTLPVSSLRLVGVPVGAGVIGVVLLYAAWMDRLSRDGPTGAVFVGTLLAAFMVLYQTVLWTLVRLGPLKLVVLGAVATSLFGIGLLPSFPPSPAPAWRSEATLTLLMAAVAAAGFLLSWRHVARLRSGGGSGRTRAVGLVQRIADGRPGRRTRFRSSADAQFWFEWRCSGLALPLLVGGVVLLVIAPLSWLARDASGDTIRLLIATLATPILLAVPVGMAFSKPTIWSDDLSVPPFLVIRPVSEADMIATKVRVAAASVAVSWLVVIVFLTTWLASWANLDMLRRLANQWPGDQGRSVHAGYGIAALILLAGMFLTWRFLINRLWTGLSGDRRLFIASVGPIVAVVVAFAVLDAGRLPIWILDDPARLTPVVWVAAAAVTAKFGLAILAWRQAAWRHIWRYGSLWLGGTGCLLALALILWDVARLDLIRGADRVHTVTMLVAVAAIPLGRIGLAASFLARNRHR